MISFLNRFTIQAQKTMFFSLRNGDRCSPLCNVQPRCNFENEIENMKFKKRN